MKYILATTISTLALIVIIPIHALAQLPLLPMQDPQRFNDHRDARTQAAINLENTMLKSAAQADLVGDTAKHNAAILLNNMAVCYNAARNGDNLTSFR